jgi:hypothetical protein
MRPSPQMWRNFQGSGDWWRFEGWLRMNDA